jgi:uncharacterized protein YkwD
MRRQASPLRILALLAATLALFGVLASALAPAASAHRLRHHRRTVRRRHPRPRRRGGGAVVGAGGGAATTRSSAANACANADSPAPSGSLDAMRIAVLCLVNEQRAARGLPPLTLSPLLDRSAQNWTNVMLATGNFSHGASLSGRLSAVGYNWRTGGENIATGYLTPRAVVGNWMASFDHCQNILNPSFRDVGVGELPGEIPSPIGSSGRSTTWTADFGLQMSQTAPSNNWQPADGCPY